MPVPACASDSSEVPTPQNGFFEVLPSESDVVVVVVIVDVATAFCRAFLAVVNVLTLVQLIELTSLENPLACAAATMSEQY